MSQGDTMKRIMNTPVGWLELLASADALLRIQFLDRKPETAKEVESGDSILDKTARQLTEYFEGERKAFSVPLEPEGSDFQQKVWEQLQQIPYGTTISYGTLAQRLGNANKVRAAGRANGQNPIPIIVPCHRVIGADDSLVGYAGGIERKRYLLKLEGALLL